MLCYEAENDSMQRPLEDKSMWLCILWSFQFLATKVKTASTCVELSKSVCQMTWQWQERQELGTVPTSASSTCWPLTSCATTWCTSCSVRRLCRCAAVPCRAFFALNKRLCYVFANAGNAGNAFLLTTRLAFVVSSLCFPFVSTSFGNSLLSPISSKASASKAAMAKLVQVRAFQMKA